MRCENCNGTGKLGFQQEECWFCGGEGMMNMNFKIGDKIRYSLISNVTIIGEDDLHFILKDKNANEKKVYKDLVNKYGKLES